MRGEVGYWGWLIASGMHDSGSRDGLTRGGGETAGAESKGWKVVAAGAEGKGWKVIATPVLPYANDLSRTGGAGTGARVSVGGLTCREIVIPSQVAR